MALAMGLVKVHSLTSKRELNGCTGTLGAWNQNTNRYQVFVAGSEYFIKVENLYSVDPGWVQEVLNSPMKGRLSDMTRMFAAPGFYPCPLKDLQVLPKNRGGRGTTRQLLQSWWGDKVFQCIREKMEQQRMRKGMSNWDMELAIQQGNLFLAGVRSCGGREEQLHPRDSYAGEFFMVWPTIVYAMSGSHLWWSYCQGLAMQGASAWPACFDALEIYGPYMMIEEPVVDIPSTVVIEEVGEALENEEWEILD